MPRRSSRPPKGGSSPPKDDKVEVRVKPGVRPGAEVYEIEYDSVPPPPKDEHHTRPTPPAGNERQDARPNDAPTKPPAPMPMPPEALPSDGDLEDDLRATNVMRRRPSDEPDEDDLRATNVMRRRGDDDAPPGTMQRSLRSTNLGLGVPGPSYGGDTALDPFDTSRANAWTTGPGGTLPGADRARPTEAPAPTRRLGAEPLPSTRRAGASGDDFDLGLAINDDGNDALDLVGARTGENEVAPATPPSPSAPPAAPTRGDPLAELRERYALGDFSGALTIAEAILEEQPSNADVQRYAESCRDVLRQMYAARLGPLTQVPSVAVPVEQLRWLTLDHRAGFLLSHVDGVSTLEEILDVSGMPPLEAMRIIYDLVQQKVIALNP